MSPINYCIELTYNHCENGFVRLRSIGVSHARSEFTSATLGSDNYAFDHIGNRVTEAVARTQSAYSTNALNQYTGINTENTENAEEANNSVNSVASVFNPSYDADGNMTQVLTSTGTWAITYNGENRPVRFENAGTQTVVECRYDSQGRRFEKKVTVAGTTTLHHRYIYRGYLQIAALDLTRAAHPALWLVTWDPSLGRFLSRDPIAEQGGLNLYAFVGNSVLLKFDYCGNMISKISGEYSSLTPIFSAEDSVFPMGEMARVKVEDKTRLSIDLLKSAWVTFFNHTYILKSEGSLRLSLIWRRDKKALFDDRNSSLNMHEKKHFEDYKKVYNEMIEEFNSYDEKTLCAKKVPCRQEVREYSQALRSFYLLKADFAAAVFHSTAESGYSDEMRNAELALKRRQDLPSTIKNYGDYVVYLQNRIMADATNVEELKKSLDKCINENQ